MEVGGMEAGEMMSDTHSATNQLDTHSAPPPGEQTTGRLPPTDTNPKKTDYPPADSSISEPDSALAANTYESEMESVSARSTVSSTMTTSSRFEDKGPPESAIGEFLPETEGELKPLLRQQQKVG